MRDAYAQREDERAREDDGYLRLVDVERRERMLEYAPQGPCHVCQRYAAEVEPGTWLCACFGGYE